MNIIEKFVTNNDCYKSNVANVDGRYTDFQNNGQRESYSIAWDVHNQAQVFL